MMNTEPYDDDFNSDIPAADKSEEELTLDAVLRTPGYETGEITVKKYRELQQKLIDSSRPNKSTLDEFPDVDEKGNKIRHKAPGSTLKGPGG